MLVYLYGYIFLNFPFKVTVCVMFFQDVLYLKTISVFLNEFIIL